MAKSRYVQDSFWTDPYVDELETDEKCLFLYYLTNPLCNIAGIYEIKDSRASYDTKIKKERLQEIKNRLEHDGKLMCKDDWIILVNFARHQAVNPNVKAGMQRIIDDLPDKVKALKGFESLSYFTLLNLTIPNLSVRAEPQKQELKVLAENTTSKELGSRTAATNAWQDQAWLEEMAGKWTNKLAGQVPERFIQNEIKKFFLYWTEKSPGSKKMRFEKQTVFDPARRLGTWMNRALESGYSKQLQNNKYQIGEV